jgi:large subunit ribosomal protein L7/L12
LKKRRDKKKDLETLHGELAKVSTVILTTFQGITVQLDTKLRRAVESVGGRYRVLKNTLAERAGAGTPAEPLLKNLTGTNSIAYTSSDPVGLAKVLMRVAKEVPAFQFKAGLVEGRVVSIEEIQQLAQLPSKEELVGKIIFLAQAPARRSSSVIAAICGRLVTTIHAAVNESRFVEQLRREVTGMANKVETILEEIKGLTLLEAAELVKKMEAAFGVSAVAPMVMTPGAPAAAGAAAPGEEKTEFAVVLTEVGANKINVIKAVREVTSLGLKEAKDLVDGVPKTVKEGLSKEETAAIKKKFEDAGAKIEIR